MLTGQIYPSDTLQNKSELGQAKSNTVQLIFFFKSVFLYFAYHGLVYALVFFYRCAVMVVIHMNRYLLSIISLILLIA